jgi:glycosyltransferase involved in cell wall biosynthesis
MFAEWRWSVLELPPRHFSWRVRGSPLYWSMERRSVLEGEYDLLLATSMVDLATLRGLVSRLSRLPAVLYFHENQFAYPQHRQRHSLLEAQMVSLYAALSADRIAFNSAYNRDTFLEGCRALLARLPDYVPKTCVAELEKKSRVLPVPLKLAEICEVPARWPGKPGTYPGRPLRLLWSGRFEHDKGGDELLALLRCIEGSGLDYELALTGQQFRSAPPVFETISREFAPRLVQFGFIECRRDYHALLRGADLVLSTARHEFQGLSVLEAVAAGCLPVVPDRLAYPAIYPPQFRYACEGGDDGEARAAATLVGELAAAIAERSVSPPEVGDYDAGVLAAPYRELFREVTG